jgi:hypothetical protein
MKRGTALKWIEQIQSKEYSIGTGQLRYENDFDPLGVLCDFLDPHGWKQDYIGYTWHGEKFKLPEDWRKKIKMKTLYGEFITDNGQKTEIDHTYDWNQVTQLIEKYYEQM